MNSTLGGKDVRTRKLELCELLNADEKMSSVIEHLPEAVGDNERSSSCLLGKKSLGGGSGIPTTSTALFTLAAMVLFENC